MASLLSIIEKSLGVLKEGKKTKNSDGICSLLIESKCRFFEVKRVDP